MVLYVHMRLNYPSDLSALLVYSQHNYRKKSHPTVSISKRGQLPHKDVTKWVTGSKGKVKRARR